jgi:hypothetical protein
VPFSRSVLTDIIKELTFEEDPKGSLGIKIATLWNHVQCHRTIDGSR